MNCVLLAALIVFTSVVLPAAGKAGNSTKIAAKTAAKTWYFGKTYFIKLGYRFGRSFRGAYAFGRSPIKRPTLDTWRNFAFIPDVDHKIKMKGRLVAWQVYIKRANHKFSMMVLRRVGRSGNKYKVITMKTLLPKHTGVMTIPVKARVKRGDLLGFDFPGYSTIPFTNRTCLTGEKGALYIRGAHNMTKGKVYSFSPMKTCRDYSFAVAVKPKNRRSNYGNRRYNYDLHRYRLAHHHHLKNLKHYHYGMRRRRYVLRRRRYVVRRRRFLVRRRRSVVVVHHHHHHGHMYSHAHVYRLFKRLYYNHGKK